MDPRAGAAVFLDSGPRRRRALTREAKSDDAGGSAWAVGYVESGRVAVCTGDLEVLCSLAGWLLEGDACGGGLKF